MSEHGYGRYTNGCRCDICRAAKRAYMAERRASGSEPNRVGVTPRPAWHDKAAGRMTGIQHGTSTGYRRGCRCWDCTAANSRRQSA